MIVRDSQLNRTISSYNQRKRIIISFFCLLLLDFSYSSCQPSNCYVNWKNPIQLSFDSVLSVKPQEAVTDYSIHIIWYGIDTLGTASHDGIQYTHSLDSGKTFSPQITLISPDTAFDPGLITASGNVVCVVFTGLLNSTLGTLLIRSQDGGNTWEQPVMLLQKARPQLISAMNSDIYIHFTVMDGNSNGLLRSTDNGSTWNKMTANMPLMTDLRPSSGTIHAVGSIFIRRHVEAGYYYSANFGASWVGPEIISKEDPISSLYPRIAVNDDDTRFIIWNDTGRIMMRRSNGYDEDENLIWEQQVTLSDGKNATVPDIATNDKFISVTWDNTWKDFTSTGFSQSIDGGTSFCMIDSPTIGNQTGESLVESAGNKIHLVWSSQINGNVEISYRLGTLNVESKPKKFTLRQNYPNPFNGITHIEYDLPKSTYVRLNIFNILGQKVATLVDGWQEPQRYNIALEGNQFPTGVYFYQLSTIYFIETKKLIILR